MSKLKPRDQHFLEVLEASETGQKIIAETRAKVAAERQKLIDELHALEAAQEREYPNHEKAIQDQVAKVRAAEQSLKGENAKLNAVVNALHNAKAEITSRRNQIETALRNIPEEALISQFRSSLYEDWEETRRKFDYVCVGDVDPLSGVESERVFNNMESINARVEAIRQAIAAAEDLLLVADPFTIPARLAALRANLPDVKPASIPAKK
jgi:type I site-specific restriction endonuclease